MLMKYTIYYITTFLAVLLSACTTSDDAGNMPQTLNMRVNDFVEVKTRASNDVQNDAFQTDENINIWVWDAGVLGTSTATYSYSYELQTNIQHKVVNVDVSKTLVPKDLVAFKFPLSGVNEEKVNIRACYPVQEQYESVTEINMQTLRNTPATFTIQTDQSTEAGYKASDLMYGLPTAGNPVKNNNSLVGMTFNHKMAKVIIEITAGQGIDDLTGIDVELSCVLNAAVRTEAPNYDMVVEPTTGNEKVSGTVKVNTADMVSGQTVATMAAVIPPQEFPHDQTFITITRGNVTYIYAPTSDISFLSCSKNTFYITIEEYRLIVSGTITPWNADGDEKVLTGTIYEVIAREEETPQSNP